MRLRIHKHLVLMGAIVAAVCMAGCAYTAPRKGTAEEPKPSVDKVMMRLLSDADYRKAMKMAEGMAASKDYLEQEMGLYWKAITFLHRDLPESAMSILEANEGRWTGMRKVHGTVLLNLTRDANRTRSSTIREEANRFSADKPLHEKIESLQKEAADIRAENLRLVAEKKKYLKLLKDLETIR